MQGTARCLAFIPLLFTVACATGQRQDLVLADMLPAADDRGPASPDYTVFFDLDSAALTADTIATLDQLVQDPARPNWTRIQVAGHADRSGSERHNKTLSADRAEAVRRYLVSTGVPGPLVVTAAYGERQVLVGTPDGAVEPQNRRVEVYLRSK